MQTRILLIRYGVQDIVVHVRDYERERVGPLLEEHMLCCDGVNATAFSSPPFSMLDTCTIEVVKGSALTSG